MGFSRNSDYVSAGAEETLNYVFKFRLRKITDTLHDCNLH